MPGQQQPDGYKEDAPQVKKPERKGGFIPGVFVGAFAALAVTVLTCAVTVGIYAGRGLRSSSAGPGGPSSTDGVRVKEGLDFEKIAAKMGLIEQVIDRYFLYEEDTELIEDSIYAGMMDGLGDVYSTYYSPEDYAAMQESTSGVYSGIGAVISQNQTTGLCTVIKVFEGSPALEAGMQPGDIIYEVDHTAVAGESLEVIVNNYVKGEEGTGVLITVYRADADAYVDLEVIRRRIEVPTVESMMLTDHIGYIQVSEFDVVTVEQFETAVDTLLLEGMESLVIDLRNNPGGVLDGAVKMADYLLADDLADYEKGGGATLIVYTADKNGEGDVYTASDGHSVDLPVAIIMNGESASAAEVFAGALKDYGKAKIVGTVSFGKGIVQNLIPLGDGSAVKLTSAHYYTPSGYDLHGKGIEPDVVVELSEEFKTQAVVDPLEDNQIAAALDILSD